MAAPFRGFLTSHNGSSVNFLGDGSPDASQSQVLTGLVNDVPTIFILIWNDLKLNLALSLPCRQDRGGCQSEIGRKRNEHRRAITGRQAADRPTSHIQACLVWCPISYRLKHLSVVRPGCR